MLIKADNFTADELAKMRRAGKIIAELYAEFREVLHAGMTGVEANDWFAKNIREKGAHPSYTTDPDAVGFPGVVCISVNDVVVHGAPNAEAFAKGDLVSLDLVVDIDGICADAATTFCVDEEPKGAKKMLMRETERSLYAGIDAIKYKNGEIQTGDISRAIEKVLNRSNLGIVRDLVGHGIGREMHQAPEITNYFDRRMNDRVPVGNALAIEPMATLGTHKVIQDAENGWDIRTADGSLSAHFEHTVLLAEDGVEIITQL